MVRKGETESTGRLAVDFTVGSNRDQPPNISLTGHAAGLTLHYSFGLRQGNCPFSWPEPMADSANRPWNSFPLILTPIPDLFRDGILSSHYQSAGVDMRAGSDLYSRVKALKKPRLPGFASQPQHLKAVWLWGSCSLPQFHYQWNEDNYGILWLLY